MADDPLNKAFDLDPDHLDMGDGDSGYAFPFDDIPEYISLDDITHMALYAYKEQLKDVTQVPARYRQRALEVAQTYLNLAKDAVSKRDDNDIKKAAKALNTKNPSSGALADNSEDGATEGVSRREVYKQIEQEAADETKRNSSGGGKQQHD